MFAWPAAYAPGVPGNGPLPGGTDAFVQVGLDYFCLSTSLPAVFAVTGTSEAISCPRGGATNFGATDSTVALDGSSVSASSVGGQPVAELKGCAVAESNVGPGGQGAQIGFDMRTAGGTLYLEVNNGGTSVTILSASDDQQGLEDPFMDTEIANMSTCSTCPEKPGIGDNLNSGVGPDNAGMEVDVEEVATYYYDDTVSAWGSTPLVSNSPNTVPFWYDVAFLPNVTADSVSGIDVYLLPSCLSLMHGGALLSGALLIELMVAHRHEDGLALAGATWQWTKRMHRSLAT